MHDALQICQLQIERRKRVAFALSRVADLGGFVSKLAKSHLFLPVWPSFPDRGCLTCSRMTFVASRSCSLGSPDPGLAVNNDAARVDGSIGQRGCGFPFWCLRPRCGFKQKSLRRRDFLLCQKLTPSVELGVRSSCRQIPRSGIDPRQGRCRKFQLINIGINRLASSNSAMQKKMTSTLSVYRWE